MNKRYVFRFLLVLNVFNLWLPEPANAKESEFSRYSSHSFSIGTGTQSVYTDLVTPLPYKGLAALVQYQGQTHTQRPTLSQEWLIRVEGALPRNPTLTRQGQYAAVRSSYGLLHQFPSMLKGLDMYLGGNVCFETQVFYQAYLPSNPPIASHVQVNIEAAFRARYQWKIGRLPMEAHYALSIPVIGAGFYPDFGLSYAEIFMKQTPLSSYIGLSTFHKRFAMDHQVALDLIFKKTRLRLSYIHNSYWTYNKGIHTQGHLNTFNLGLILDIANLSGQRLNKHNPY